MSHPSAPPSYEESVNPLYPPSAEPGYPISGPYPPGGNAPYPPGGNALYPPGGNAPYPPGGNAPYPPGGNAPYPPGGNSDFPSMFPHSGNPMGPPMMPTIPLNPAWSGGSSGAYGSPGTDPESGTEGFTSSSWDDRKVRHAFIRKVYMILTVQLTVTFGIVAVFTFSAPVQQFVRTNSAVYWSAYGVFIVIYFVLICCEGPRRKFPWNVILLAIFTLAMSYLTGTIASYHSTKSVFLCLGITALVCLGVTIFCFQTKVDFTSCGGLFCALGIGLFVAGIVVTIVLSFKYIPWLHMLYSAIAAIVFTLFLAFDTQLILGNRRHSISPEEYVYGALRLYTDIVQIFIYLLQLFGSR
ncbi:protein lifeguard 3-like [Carcharodon carcharias]|uniref:protein lifeguard 3-like n=1 Tax=Carcharodon carcharias TaxID=13397 RepID=UPI001B7E554B|nr:protein lifeguard 3-like [Carcharodon carcharias]XP_041057573.1 protein lifeguard 3-like [Carcharodon carcharias]XP_041057574.1 protein lifeguard 3-like [Carcharodon carcharias]XP_041057575.1 protein lifeguard 3-like [Carcharodon carcharias]